MGKLIVGVQMYTLRDYCKTVNDTAETLKKVREMGYKVVQVSGMAEPKDVKELKKLLDDNGLYPCSTHTGYERIVKDTETVIEEHMILGCETIICPGLPVELRNRDGYLKVAEEFSKVMEKIKGSGLTLGYHNHGIELQRYGEKTGLEILLDNCDGLEAEIDTYWVQYGGGDPAEWIEKFSGRCSQLHFKDMGMINNQQVMPPIGEGNLNWERIIKKAKKAGAKYCLVEMDTPTIDAFESLKRSLEFLTSMGLKV
ncbi:MAG: sugar phosphate isomerase/epimerase [Candidatus Omnitrophica bacterium]|nr:sugar phosphate isomerase/epimerase [Candidatus Omnitrophota bacterium]